MKAEQKQLIYNIIRDAVRILDENYKTSERHAAIKNLKKNSGLLEEEI